RMLARKNLQAQGKGRARRYPREVVLALQEVLCRGRGVATSNHYLTAVKGFTRWLAKGRRAPYDPLACLSAQNAKTDVRVERRALAAEELTPCWRPPRRANPPPGWAAPTPPSPPRRPPAPACPPPRLPSWPPPPSTSSPR